jgi:hypothetical protein
VQFLVESHTPADVWQTTVAGWKVSAGQAAEVPVQFWLVSHGPLAV